MQMYNARASYIYSSKRNLISKAKLFNDMVPRFEGWKTLWVSYVILRYHNYLRLINTRACFQASVKKQLVSFGKTVLGSIKVFYNLKNIDNSFFLDSNIPKTHTAAKKRV